MVFDVQWLTNRVEKLSEYSTVGCRDPRYYQCIEEHYRATLDHYIPSCRSCSLCLSQQWLSGQRQGASSLANQDTVMIRAVSARTGTNLTSHLELFSPSGAVDDNIRSILVIHLTRLFPSTRPDTMRTPEGQISLRELNLGFIASAISRSDVAKPCDRYCSVRFALGIGDPTL